MLAREAGRFPRSRCVCGHSAVCAGRPDVRDTRCCRCGRHRRAARCRCVLCNQRYRRGVRRSPGPARVSAVGRWNIKRNALGRTRHLCGQPGFDVPFAHGEVQPALGSVVPAPVVVQFPRAVTLESAYLLSIASQNIPRCMIYSPFIGPPLGGPKLPIIAESGIPDAAAHIAPVAAPLAQPALPVTCKASYRDPRVDYEASAAGPLVLLAGAQVMVRAQLQPDGKMLAYTVYGAPDSSLRQRAIAATLNRYSFHRSTGVRQSPVRMCSASVLRRTKLGLRRRSVRRSWTARSTTSIIPRSHPSIVRIAITAATLPARATTTR